jgi:uncharacterized spore protein YtfJ
MDVQETISKARDAITVKRVYGDAYERNGLTVIPAAAVAGGAGGGSGEGPEKEGSGAGAGFGLGARPVGAYVIDHDSVRWVPARDINRIAQQALIVAGIVALWALRRRGA